MVVFSLPYSIIYDIAMGHFLGNWPIYTPTCSLIDTLAEVIKCLRVIERRYLCNELNTFKSKTIFYHKKTRLKPERATRPIPKGRRLCTRPLQGRFRKEEGPCTRQVQGRFRKEEGPCTRQLQGRSRKEEGPCTRQVQGRSRKEEGLSVRDSTHVRDLHKTIHFTCKSCMVTQLLCTVVLSPL